MPPMSESDQRIGHGNGPQYRRILYLAGGEHAPISQDALIFTIPFAQLSAEELARVSPDTVVFPLFTANLDATVILTELKALGYRGRCLVLTPRLPKPHLIEAELRGCGGAMQIELLTTDAPMG
ncbi:MAG: hypothetical protein JWS10_3990 [Cypionkella sp.]|uniref:hypothetical protein n=1 Tax=Cypionkella sp. TaxID=2811411 RepID=UPI0026211A88|nr:hypothetical protein [Cypionkella sp.]MDB5661375.1 hypothetical protein [Cypionkella sp.]